MPWQFHNINLSAKDSLYYCQAQLYLCTVITKRLTLHVTIVLQDLSHPPFIDVKDSSILTEQASSISNTMALPTDTVSASLPCNTT